jgi:hypothetical protein
VIARPLFRSLSRPLFRALSGAVSAITKVLIDLSPTSNGFYSLGADSVLTTAYKLGISTVLPTASTTYALYGRASSATDYFKILSSGYLSLDVNGTVVTSTVLATKDLKYREYSVTLDGNDFVFKENDTVISTVTNATAAAKTLTLNLIGNSNGANFYLGILADAVMGAITFPLDNLTGNTETSNGVTLTYQNIGTDVRDTYTLIDDDYLGSELIVNGNFATDTNGWTAFRADTVINNGVEITPTASEGGIYQDVSIADSIKVSATLTSVSGAGYLRSYPTAGFGGTPEETSRSDAGDLTVSNTVNNTRVYLRVLSGSVATFDNVSVKRKIEVA